MDTMEIDTMEIETQQLELIYKTSELFPESTEGGYASDISTSSSSTVEFILNTPHPTGSQRTTTPTRRTEDNPDFEFASTLSPDDWQKILEHLLGEHPELLDSVERWAPSKLKDKFEMAVVKRLSTRNTRGVLENIYRTGECGSYDSFEGFLRATKNDAEAPPTWSLNAPSERQESRRVSFDLPIVASTLWPRDEDMHGGEEVGLMRGFNKMTLAQNPRLDVVHDRNEIQSLCRSMIESATRAERRTIVHDYEKVHSSQDPTGHSHVGCSEETCYGGSCGFEGCKFRGYGMAVDDGGDFERLDRYCNEALMHHFLPLAERRYREEASMNREEAMKVEKKGEGTSKRTHSTAFSRSGNENKVGHKKQNCTFIQMGDWNHDDSGGLANRRLFGKR